MSVSTTSTRATGTGDGSTTVFSFSFACLQASDVKVYKDGVLQSTGYTTSVNSNGVGGTVTFTTAPASGVDILLIRVVDYTQATELPVEGNIPEDTLEDALDKLTMLVQQVKEITDRALTNSITSSGVSSALPDPSALDLLRWNSDEDALENVSPGSALSDTGGNGGNVVGPSSISTVAYQIPLWADALGRTLDNGVSGVGEADQALLSAGSGARPVFTNIPGLLRARGITATTRTLPTSGALSGTYVHFGDWTSTGALTFTHGTRIYLRGNMTLNHTLTGTAQSNGGITGNAYRGQNGGGPGGGSGGEYIAAIGAGHGGGGGGSAGAGGNGGSGTANVLAQGGPANPLSIILGGSGGGSGCGNGTSLGQSGGGGGPAIYIEVYGNITDNESTSANGAAGSNGVVIAGGGGGGGGGSIVKRCSGTYTLAAAKSNSATGGAGGNTSTGHKGGGGGGGYIEIWSGGAQTISGSNTVTGGSKGTGSSTQDATDGSAGTTNLIASTQPISLF